MRIKVDLSKCTGCSLCELACSAVKDKVYNPEKSRIKVIKQGLPPCAAVLTCAQCLKPACQAACPSQAITRDDSTGALVVEESLCLVCGLCVDACPLDAIKLHPDNVSAIKCDLCGGKPKCVDNCPRGALSLFTKKQKIPDTAKNLVKHHLEKNGLSQQQFLIAGNK